MPKGSRGSRQIGTLPALEAPGVRRHHRWKLVGNAVSVPVFRWVGDRLRRPGVFDKGRSRNLLPRGVAWPKAAWGFNGAVYPVDVSMWPVRIPAPHLRDFVKYPLAPLSGRAAAGFLGRAETSGLHFEVGFLDAVRRHAARMLRLEVA